MIQNSRPVRVAKDFAFPMDSTPARYTTPEFRKHETFFLYGQIKDEANYVDLIHTILTMGEDEELTIRINTPGGSLFSALAIANAIEQCAGTVITVIDAEASSGGSLVWFAGHHRVIASENVMMMIHTYSSVNAGNSAEQRVTLEAMDALWTNLADSYYKFFMSEAEWLEMKSGKDIFYTGKDIVARIKQLSAAAEKAQAEKDAVKKSTGKAASAPKTPVKDEAVAPAKKVPNRRVRKPAQING